ncbi:MAG: acetate kinase [Desulfomonile tiedjei]|nr:acetate kinase [Desulfomonile tiedjei]
MKILVINSGSSSLKYTLFEMNDESVLFSGTIDRIGLGNASHSFSEAARETTTEEKEIADQGAALDEMLKTLASAGPVGPLDELSAVAHRVGHGGKYRDAVRITPDVIAEITRMTPMIPLHHPAMIREIEECHARMPKAIHCAVFDTWFHWSIPDEAAIYGLPYRYFEKGYRRTGFHGNSHAYVSGKAAEFLGQPIEELRIISCHLGNGASVCAIDRGRSIDTSLGMTAVEGLMMGTRSGDVDPGLLPVIMQEDSLSPGRMTDMLFKDSGLLGISGVSRDMREVEAAAARGNPRASLALNAFCYKVKRYIGAMLMVLGGCDVLIFTGGIGLNSPTVRSKSLEGAAGLGFVIDEEANLRATTEAQNLVTDISAASSKVKILVARTFEELMMARQCAAVVERELAR